MSQSDREFDLIIFGASGFTGRLVAEYLAQHREPTGELKWAMAGRSRAKLAEVRAEMGIPESIPLVEVDIADQASVEAMVARSSCVVTTVGPYQLYGSGLVAACAAAGTHYVDLCGEPGWMHDMIQAHSAQAAQSGARIVFSCGFDSIPFDLGVYALQQCVTAASGAAASRIRCRVLAMNGEFSGGTAASLGATMAAIATRPDLINILTNPFSLTEPGTGPAQPAGDQPEYIADEDLWLAPFIMAPINTKNVHRSNFLMGHPYGKEFVYDEMMVAGQGDEGQAVASFIATHNPLEGDNVPQPGEGPSKEVREAGNYDLLFIAENASQRYRVTGDMDPGYGSTSKMIAQAGICLIRDCSDLAGGIYTPAPAMGDKLIARLSAHAGMSFSEVS